MKLEKLIKDFYRENKDKEIAAADIYQDEKGRLSLIPADDPDNTDNFSMYSLELIDDEITLRGNFSCYYPVKLFSGEPAGIERVYEVTGPLMFEKHLLERLKSSYDPEEVFISAVNKHPLSDKNLIIDSLCSDFDYIMETMKAVEDMPLEEFQAIVGNIIFMYDSGITNRMEIHKGNLVEEQGDQFLTCGSALEILRKNIKNIDIKTNFRTVNSFMVDDQIQSDDITSEFNFNVLDDHFSLLPQYMLACNSLYLFSNIDEIMVTLEKDFRGINSFKPSFKFDISDIDNLQKIIPHIYVEDMPDYSPSNMIISPDSRDLEKEIESAYLSLERQDYFENDLSGYNDMQVGVLSDMLVVEQSFKTKDEEDVMISFDVVLGEETAVVRPLLNERLIKNILSGMGSLDYKRYINFGRSVRRKLGKKEYNKAKAILGSEKLPVSSFRAHAKDRKASLNFKNGHFNFFNWYSNPYEELGFIRYYNKPLRLNTQQMFSMLDNYKEKDIYLREVCIKGKIKDMSENRRLDSQIFGKKLGLFDNYVLFKGKYNNLRTDIVQDFQDPLSHTLNIYVPRSEIGSGKLRDTTKKIAESIASTDFMK